MMRVLYILHSSKVFEGSTKSFLALLSGLKGKEWEPYVVLPGPGDLYAELQRRGIQCLSLNYRRSTYPPHQGLKNKFLFLPRLLYWRFLEARAVGQVTDFCRTRDIDIIHTNVSVEAIGVKVASRLHLPALYHFREFGDIDFGMHYFPTHARYMRRLQRENVHYICITRAIMQHHGLEGNSKAHVIYNGILSKNYQCDQALSPQNFFLYAGRIEEAKGVMMLIEAYRAFLELSAEVVDLLIAGSETHSSYAPEVRDYVARNNMSAHVHFLGNRSDIYRLMQQARAIIIPSRFEAFGRCMAEAMFNNCLVIGRNTGGTKEQFDNGLRMTSEEIGLRFSTIEELTAHLIACSNARTAEDAAMIQRASTVVRQLYSLENNAQQIYQLYREIMHNTTEHRP
ncbi:MAG: glycosyltransferase family 4 protein [Bacteroidaceae bacterium]|nr:glycosyltransferase family 4 protein [Bacteroidaceae bacterium]